MYHIGTWGGDFTGDARGHDLRARGYARASLVDRSTGATHTDVGTCRLAPGGELPLHVHSYEEAAYVLEGHPAVELDGRRYRLGPGDYVFFPVGVPHRFANPGTGGPGASGPGAGVEARWLDLNTPQAVLAGEPGEDTYFLPARPGDAAVEELAGAEPPDLADPRTRHLGHYDGTPPQHEALAVSGPARGRAPAGMNTAVLAYSGISVKMLVDQNLGAELLTMFTVDYEPGGAAQVHDHPFEEVYVFLSGEIAGEIEGARHTLRAGDVLFCGVGSSHGFFNESDGRVRWLETQAPQPPRRHAYRWPAHWQHLKERLEQGR